ncbi:MAG TPA: hypothetical protein VL087_02260 [Nitrospirota bacterium]|nr:hypothetical protein [Nitrospirota bacterium]
MDVILLLMRSRLSPFDRAVKYLFRKIKPGGPAARRVRWYEYLS